MNKRLHDFVMKTIKRMIGNVPDWEVSEYALGWYSKNVLTDEDIMEIDDLIEAKNNPPEEPEEDSPQEEAEV